MVNTSIFSGLTKTSFFGVSFNTKLTAKLMNKKYNREEEKKSKSR